MDPVQQREPPRDIEFSNQIDIRYFADGRSARIGAMQEQKILSYILSKSDLINAGQLN
jgi:hypothetical protein